ncbi:Cysteine desulfurase CsdA [compost metagenome]
MLWGRPEALERLAHWQFGGEMVRVADYQTAEFHAAPMGFEAGTPPIDAVIGLGASLDWLMAQDEVEVAAHEDFLHAALLAGLEARDGVSILGEPQIALASFTVGGVHSADLSHLLTEQGIAVRTGHHCAMPLLKSLGVGSAVRVSLGLYNDSSDLERFFNALDRALELLR